MDLYYKINNYNELTNVIKLCTCNKINKHNFNKVEVISEECMTDELINILGKSIKIHVNPKLNNKIEIVLTVFSHLNAIYKIVM